MANPACRHSEDSVKKPISSGGRTVLNGVKGPRKVLFAPLKDCFQFLQQDIQKSCLDDYYLQKDIPRSVIENPRHYGLIQKVESKQKPSRLAEDVTKSCFNHSPEIYFSEQTSFKKDISKDIIKGFSKLSPQEYDLLWKDSPEQSPHKNDLQKDDFKQDATQYYLPKEVIENPDKYYSQKDNCKQNPRGYNLLKKVIESSHSDCYGENVFKHNSLAYDSPETEVIESPANRYCLQKDIFEQSPPKYDLQKEVIASPPHEYYLQKQVAEQNPPKLRDKGSKDKMLNTEKVPQKIEGVVAYGPWGGTGGFLFDDGIYTGIKQINLSRNDGITSMKICYDRDGKDVWGSTHGDIGGFIFDRVIFDYPSEILTHISGTYGPVVYTGPDVIKSISFHTNKRKHGPFGEQKGSSFTNNVKAGRIVGFLGRQCLFLDAVGVYVVKMDIPEWSNKSVVTEPRPSEEESRAKKLVQSKFYIRPFQSWGYH